ncbi:MAG TPA: His/Gly/Thr/Pro-type tRNA ligase C-terminal domain-containing protein [Candidatus Paceibacterota bacterium]|nr:His/Gly/Thr/Pro-type tRNA ligase C-terminal domain-containing protein [Candidatus Paceibacterota bacterium]HQI25742.1 His/Gly/Thr/Pro-type tRNA ligase C-terminal domain-containing protein [Candidatus Paceibacterota bacterium]
MFQSQLFSKTRREDPKGEVSQNAKLLIRAGFIHKEMAGVYSYLPLGLRVLNKINDIIRKEMDALGAVELELTALQNPLLYEKTDRWSGDKVDIWFKTELQTGGELGLGFTHEEAITELLKNHVSSYKDLPRAIYQIQTKFRNETRAKSGILRGREFLMKDLYSFHVSEEDLDNFYDKVKGAYERIFERIGLGDSTYITFASGGVFSKYSHEFQTLSEAGEDLIYLSEEKKLAVNKEVLNDETLSELGLSRDELSEKKSIEVGNIFKLGTRFSQSLGLYFKDEKGESRPVVMGCYGLGPARIMGVIAEIKSDNKGLVWPRAVAPFDIHLVVLGKEVGLSGDREALTETAKTALEIYEELTASGKEVLCDDRDLSAGEKLADADLLGIPFRLVISDSAIKKGKFELVDRATGEIEYLSEAELLNKVR